MFENTTVCALFVAGAFAATFPLEFTICLIGLIGCFLIVYCDFTGGPDRFRFSAGNGVYASLLFFAETVFTFGVAKNAFCFFGFTVAENEIGLFFFFAGEAAILIGFINEIGFDLFVKAVFFFCT